MEVRKWTNQIIKYLNKKYRIKKDVISEIIIDWKDKKGNLLEKNSICNHKKQSFNYDIGGFICDDCNVRCY